MKRHGPLKYAFLCLLSMTIYAQASFAEPPSQKLPEGFVYIDEIIPDIVIELRYYTDHNFIGKKIDGYVKPRCILSRQATAALAKVQSELKSFGLGLKIFDAYRPQQAVDHFVRWAEDVEDTRMKSEFYPDVDKNNLIKDAYIASRSSHSRGSTVDLTIVSLQEEDAAKELDMGSCFDFFGAESWPYHPGIPSGSRAYRMLLHVLMKKHGFKEYPNEWWHFTLQNEPFPDTYFNFPVQ